MYRNPHKELIYKFVKHLKENSKDKTFNVHNMEKVKEERENIEKEMIDLVEKEIDF